MGIRAWWRSFRKHEDEKALERAGEMRLESPEEREISKGDIEGMTLDAEVGKMFRESSSHEEEELADA